MTPRYRVEFTPAARKQHRGLPREVQERLDTHLLALASDPRPRGCRKLAGQVDQYRLRVGDYRIIYTIRDDRLLVLVLRVGHRRDIYEER